MKTIILNSIDILLLNFNFDAKDINKSRLYCCLMLYNHKAVGLREKNAAKRYQIKIKNDNFIQIYFTFGVLCQNFSRKHYVF